MNRKEDVTNSNTASNKADKYPVSLETEGQSQSRGIASGVVHEAEAARIQKQAEVEASQLIKTVIWQVQGFINKAKRLVDAADEQRELRPVEIIEDITESTIGDTANILAELLASLHYMLEKARARSDINARIMEEELRSGTHTALDKAPAKGAVLAEVAAETPRVIKELHSELQGIIASAEPEASAKPQSPQEALNLCCGEVSLEIAAPVNTMRLLELIQSLEITRGIRILGTAGSRNSGSVVSVSLDKPLPLLALLSDMPSVKQASAAPGQSNLKRISVVTKGDKARK